MTAAGVGGTAAVEPLLTVNFKDGGLPSRLRLREGIRFLRGVLRSGVFGDEGLSSSRRGNFILILWMAGKGLSRRLSPRGGGGGGSSFMGGTGEYVDVDSSSYPNEP